MGKSKSFMLKNHHTFLIFAQNHILLIKTFAFLELRAEFYDLEHSATKYWMVVLWPFRFAFSFEQNIPAMMSEYRMVTFSLISKVDTRKWYRPRHTFWVSRIFSRDVIFGIKRNDLELCARIFWLSPILTKKTLKVRV